MSYPLAVLHLAWHNARILYLIGLWVTITVIVVATRVIATIFQVLCKQFTLCKLNTRDWLLHTFAIHRTPCIVFVILMAQSPPSSLRETIVITQKIQGVPWMPNIQLPALCEGESAKDLHNRSYRYSCTDYYSDDQLQQRTIMYEKSTYTVPSWITETM